MDLISVGIAGIIIGLTFGYVWGCERGYKQGKVCGKLELIREGQLKGVNKK